MELIEKLNWRYAAKAMNGEKVAQDKIDTIIDKYVFFNNEDGRKLLDFLDIFWFYKPDATLSYFLQKICTLFYIWPIYLTQILIIFHKYL